MRESGYQAELIKRIRQRFPGCVVLKNDSSYLQGIPDLTVLYKKQWAFLEVKACFDSPVQPNQQYYVDLANELSFGAFIYPENEDEVLHALHLSWSVRRKARVSKS